MHTEPTRIGASVPAPSWVRWTVCRLEHSNGMFLCLPNAPRRRERQKNVVYKGCVQAASLVVRSGFACSHVKALLRFGVMHTLVVWLLRDQRRSICFLSFGFLMSMYLKAMFWCQPHFSVVISFKFTSIAFSATIFALKVSVLPFYNMFAYFCSVPVLRWLSF